MAEKLNVPRLRFPDFQGEWEEKRLGEALRIKHGKDQKRIEDVNGKYPILGTGGIIGRTNSPLYSLPSVLIGRKGTIDKPQYMETPFWTVDTLFYSEVIQDFHPKFLFYMFQTIRWKKYDESTGVPSLSASTIQGIKARFPSLPEQQKIASFFSLLDQRIEKQQEKISYLEEYKKGLMQKIFSQEIRFKDKNGEDYPDWEEKRLGEVLRIKHGKEQKHVENPNGKYPILGTGGIIGRTNKALYSQPSVLIGRKGNIDRPQYMETPFWTVDTLFYSEVFKGFSPKLLFYLFQTIRWKQYDESTGVPSLSASTIHGIRVTLPCLPEQQKIEQVLSKMDELIGKNKELLQQWKPLKKGLLQQMFI